MTNTQTDKPDGLDIESRIPLYTGVPEIDTMIHQLGGAPQIFAMAFSPGRTTFAQAKDVAGVWRLTLAIAKPLVRNVKGKATHVRVVLMPDDVYAVEMLRVGKLDAEGSVVEQRDMVHAAELRRTVESMTGLRLTLGTFGRVS